MHGHLKSFAVALGLDLRHKSAHDVIGGVFRYAARHPDWQVLLRGNSPIENLSDVNPDGIIADGIWDGRSKARWAVMLNTPPPRAFSGTAVQIVTDDARYAEIGVDFLCDKHLRHYAFVGTSVRASWAIRRQNAFVTCLRRRNLDVSVFADKDLGVWLKALPKPCGILAANDEKAYEILNVCRFNGISVPEQVLVLGVDNDDILCELSIPPLSSIALDFEAAGYQAAAALDLLRRGRKVRPELLTIATRGVLERASTYDVNNSARYVETARAFIRRNATHNLNVNRVARACGVSLRTLQAHFKSLTGTTIVDEIASARLNEVKNLLVSTTMPIDAIAPRCGFNNETYLKNLFKKRLGLSMREFRARETAD